LCGPIKRNNNNTYPAKKLNKPSKLGNAAKLLFLTQKETIKV